MTSLGLAVVPVPILVDEFGVVQTVRPRVGQIEKLVTTKREPPTKSAPVLDDKWLNPEFLTANFEGADGSVQELVWFGDICLKTGRITQALNAYRRAGKKAETSTEVTTSKLVPEIDFRIGVALRAKYDDQQLQEPSDFAEAAEFWTRAKTGDPNQYIWRRRIEQYGPRQIKPYPFYDWVDKAVADIKARGDDPVRLIVPLSGAEVAKPSKREFKRAAIAKNPDPDSKIILLDDKRSLVRYTSSVVPSPIKPGETARIHLQFFTDENGKWNNESSPMQVWINETDGGKSSKRLIEYPNATDPASSESRTFEFEFQTTSTIDSCVISGFALVNVCSEENGQCLFRRQNFAVEIPLK